MKFRPCTTGEVLKWKVIVPPPTSIVVRRSLINGEVARLDSERIYWSAYGDNKISRLGKDITATGRLGH